MVLEDALEGERVLVHRPLALRHLKLFSLRVQYNDPDLYLRLEAKNSQSTYLQLTYIDLYLLYETNLNWDVLCDDRTTLLSVTITVCSSRQCRSVSSSPFGRIRNILFPFLILFLVLSSNKRKSLALHGSKRSLNHPFRCVFKSSCSSSRSVYPINSKVIQLPCSPLFRYLRLHHAVKSATSSCLSSASGSTSFWSR